MNDLPHDAFECPTCHNWLLPPACCCPRRHVLNAACAECGTTFVIEFGRGRRTERLAVPPDVWKWPNDAKALTRARP
ncbi:MAG: hypothetical protein RKR03_09080 [Candidatus Competibacter sp.]|nr:hypothetical protein [Candidatus Competibacter sp.]MDS4060532.1 hypothetical protein [Candidatus Contendobacter sp.]